MGCCFYSFRAGSRWGGGGEGRKGGVAKTKDGFQAFSSSSPSLRPSLSPFALGLPACFGSPLFFPGRVGLRTSPPDALGRSTKEAAVQQKKQKILSTKHRSSVFITLAKQRNGWERKTPS